MEAFPTSFIWPWISFFILILLAAAGIIFLISRSSKIKNLAKNRIFLIGLGLGIVLLLCFILFYDSPAALPDADRFSSLVNTRIDNDGSTLIMNGDSQLFEELYNKLVRKKNYMVFEKLLIAGPANRRIIGVFGLRDIGDDYSFKILSLYIDDPDTDVRGAVIKSFSQCFDDKYMQKIEAQLNDSTFCQIPHNANPFDTGGYTTTSIRNIAEDYIKNIHGDKKSDEAGAGEYGVIKIDKIAESVLPHMQTAFGSNFLYHLVCIEENDIIAVRTISGTFRLHKVINADTYSGYLGETRLMSKEEAKKHTPHLISGMTSYRQELTVKSSITTFSDEQQALDALKNKRVIFSNMEYIIDSLYYPGEFCKVIWPEDGDIRTMPYNIPKDNHIFKLDRTKKTQTE